MENSNALVEGSDLTINDNSLLVSIIVLAYNQKNYIKQCLDSLMSQETRFDFEIILGEDESNDGTRDICVEYAQKYPEKIKLFLRSRKDVITIEGRPTGRFNFTESLKACQGNYIAVCEGDDYWIDPFKLQKQFDFLEAKTNYAFCWTRFKTYSQTEKTFSLDSNSRYFKDEDSFIDFDFETSSIGWHMGSQTLLFRRKDLSLRKCEQYKYFRDAHLIAELLKVNKGACLNFVGAVYRIHDAGVHSGISNFNRLKMAYLVNKEIYLSCKTNVFLKRKYLKSYKNYLNANINEGNLKKALLLSFNLFFKRGDFFNFLRYIKRIVTKI